MTDARQALQSFGDHYQYDVTYLLALHDSSSVAHEAFSTAIPLSHARKTLPLDAHFIARIVTMLADDCGACAQLNVRMALEAGVDRELLRTLLENPEDLPEALRAVEAHTRQVLGEEPVDAERVAFLRKVYGDEGLSELATAIAGSRLFPTLKRALGRQTSCAVPSVDV